MTAIELAQWREHPRLGADMLLKIEDLPAEVVQIVLHHHESPDGTGFPSGLSSNKIHPVAKVISISDEFFKWYRGGPSYGPGLTPKEVIEKLENFPKNPSSPYPRWEALPALKKAFGL